MAKNSKRFTKLALGALALGSSFFAASSANALSLGCQNADVVRQGLKDENQYVLVTGQAINDQRSKNIFTSNPDGSVGYNVEQGSGNATGQLCIRAKYGSIHVNSNSDFQTPSWALYGSNTLHDQYLSRLQRTNDDKVILGARVLIPQNDGTDLPGQFMMVTRGKPSTANTDLTSAGVLTVTKDNGEVTPVIAMVNVEVQQPNYANFQGRTIQTASLNPNR